MSDKPKQTNKIDEMILRDRRNLSSHPSSDTLRHNKAGKQNVTFERHPPTKGDSPSVTTHLHVAGIKNLHRRLQEERKQRYLFKECVLENTPVLQQFDEEEYAAEVEKEMQQIAGEDEEENDSRDPASGVV
jgi:hypothetical protein